MLHPTPWSGTRGGRTRFAFLVPHHIFCPSSFLESCLKKIRKYFRHFVRKTVRQHVRNSGEYLGIGGRFSRGGDFGPGLAAADPDPGGWHRTRRGGVARRAAWRASARRKRAWSSGSSAAEDPRNRASASSYERLDGATDRCCRTFLCIVEPSTAKQSPICPGLTV